MTQLMTKAPVRSQEISAVVTRADGTIEDLGVIQYYHRNPLKNVARNLLNSRTRGHFIMKTLRFFTKGV